MADATQYGMTVSITDTLELPGPTDENPLAVRPWPSWITAYCTAHADCIQSSGHGNPWVALSLANTFLSVQARFMQGAMVFADNFTRIEEARIVAELTKP